MDEASLTQELAPQVNPKIPEVKTSQGTSHGFTSEATTPKVTEPITVIGYRIESGPQRRRPSTSWALQKEGAIPEGGFSSTMPRAVTTKEITLHNPLRVRGVQGNLLDHWAAQGDPDASRLIEMWNDPDMRTSWYIRVDSYIAKKAGSLGYDGIIYNGGFSLGIPRSEVAVIDSNLVKSPIARSTEDDLRR